MAVEWDIRASDTHLATALDGSATTCTLAHPRGPAGEGYPTQPCAEPGGEGSGEEGGDKGG